MTILVTGASGFIGKNLISQIQNIRDGKTDTVSGLKDCTILTYDIDTPQDLLDEYTSKCDFVFHLAGVNRPQNDAEFMSGNFGFTTQLLNALKKHGNTVPVLITSSIQAELDNPYGKSKKAGEELLRSYGKETGTQVFIYRLQNVFGKWCKPNYNSVVATFCHNIANNIEITINNPDTVLQLVYIDDVVSEFLSAIDGNAHSEGDFNIVSTVHTVRLGHIADLLLSFKSSRQTLNVPQFDNPFVKALYSTYLSYLPLGQFSYPLKMNCDTRGSFTEVLRTVEHGQISVNISKPGITKGNHWHHTKTEKFIVVSGTGIIRFRKIDSQEITEYHVNGETLQVVDIPCGYTHNIENTGTNDMVTLMWCNECFNPQSPDTYFEEV